MRTKEHFTQRNRNDCILPQAWPASVFPHILRLGQWHTQHLDGVCSQRPHASPYLRNCPQCAKEKEDPAGPLLTDHFDLQQDRL